MAPASIKSVSLVTHFRLTLILAASMLLGCSKGESMLVSIIEISCAAFIVIYAWRWKEDVIGKNIS